MRLILIALILGCTNIGSANVLFSNPTTTPGVASFAGETEYTYSISLDSTQKFVSGDEYCASNIQGLAANSASITSTAGFNVTQGSSGGCNINSGVSVANTGGWVEVAYTGGSTIPPGSVLPAISFYSAFGIGTVADVAYGGVAQSNANSQRTANQGDVFGPLATVPEPASGMLCAALIGLGFVARSRRKSPQNTHCVLFDERVRCKNRYPVDDCLRDQHSVEKVGV